MKKLLALLFLISCCISYAQSVWQELPSQPQGGGITALATSETGDIFATTGSFNYPQVPGGVNRSTDGGTTWQNLFPVYVARTIDIADDGTIFASIWDWPTTNEGIYKSTNNGDDWQMVFDVGTNNNIFSIESGLSGYYAGSRTGLLFSVDGNSWAYDAGFPSGAGVWVRDIEVADDGTPYAATYVGVYYKDLLNWVQVPGVNPGDTITVVDIGGSGLLSNGENVTGDDDGVVLGSLAGHVYRGTPSGVTIVCYLGHEIAAFVLEEGQYLAGVYSPNASQGGAFEIATGKPVNEGLPNIKPLSAFDDIKTRSSIKIIAGFFYNAVDGAKIYTRDFATSVEGNNSEIPQNFGLGQNYPNPFNPTTTINFQIQKMSLVTLKVFDALGNEVTTLVDEELSAGTYNAIFDAKGLASGIYLYKLQASGFVKTKKLLLLK
jgi:hypothetical protein